MTTKAEWFAKYIEWSEYVDDYMVAAGLGSGAALAASYYDGELGQYWLADYTGDTTTYHARADTFNTAYAVNYGRANSWSIPGYWSFGEGLAERYIRQSDANALSDLQDLCASAAYHVSGSLPGSTVTRHELSREWAYCGIDLLQLKRIDSLSGAQQTRLDLMYSDSLLIIGDWAQNFTASYYRPFMGGITARFLIQFYELEADAGEKAAILAALEDLADYTWTACWDDAGAALLYTDRIGVNPPDTWAAAEDGNPAADLSMLSAPLYAWLWSITANSDYYIKATQLLDGALPVYNEYGNWQSGAYLGTRSADNPNGKHFNQNLIWGAKAFWDYLGEEAPSESPGSGTSTATNGLVLLGCGCGASGQAGAGAFDATQYGTVIAEYDFTDSTLVLNGSATSATNGQTVATVNAKSGAGTLTQSTDSKRPLLATAALNGQQVITFDGTDDWFTAPADWAKNRGFIVVAAVFKMTDAGGHALVQTNAASTVNLLTWINGTNFSFVAEGKRSGGAGFQRFGSLGSQDTWYGGVWTYDFAGNSCRIDTANGNMLAAGAQDGAGATANSDANGSETNTVGAGNIYGSNAFKGQLAHLIFYSAQTSQQRADLLTALEAKHGTLA